jgi:hypothetical protein
MADRDDIPAWLVVLGVLAGGAVLAALLAGARREPNRFACYQCGEAVSEGAARCPHCGARFDWTRPRRG